MATFLRMFLIFTMFTIIPAQKYLMKSREARALQEQRALEIEAQIAQGQVVQGQVTEEQQKLPEYSVDFYNKERPEITCVCLKDEGENADLGKASLRDVYGSDYYASGVVGLVGAPIRVQYDAEARPRITFYYNESELRGIPERNLILLHETADGSFDEVAGGVLDQEENSLSVPIDEPGIYLLADCYQWYSVWGVDMASYAYDIDPTQYPSDWERESYVGSIMDLADKQWAMENAPVFHVSTPEQLASVVYYNNAILGNASQLQYLEVYLEGDIDLAGYAWVPMGWSGVGNNCFNGLIDGQGHVIRNMTIDGANLSHSAFIGYSTGVEVRNITFENAYVSGGSYTGIVGGEIYMSDEWENVHVSGVLDGNNSGRKGEVGSIIGREAYLHFKDCTADVVYRNRDGSEERLEYFSHRQEVIANTPATEDFQLTIEEDGSVSRTTSEKQFRNLCWHLEVNGVEKLQRLAENETNYNPYWVFEDYLDGENECLMWLEAFTGETYTRVSNVIEYKR